MAVKSILEHTKIFLEENVKDGVHDFNHICAVLANTQRIIFNSPLTLLTDKQREAILVASILHDVDDSKFFPNNYIYQNARAILDLYYQDEEYKDLIITMIDLVSTRKNGVHRRGLSEEEDWLLYPRYADRLEALGEIGIERARLYSYYVNRPLYLPETKRATSEKELVLISPLERFEAYLKGSKMYPDTFIDHLYDKVLHIGKKEAFAGCNNPYVLQEVEKRHKIVIGYLINFGINGHL